MDCSGLLPSVYVGKSRGRRPVVMTGLAYIMRKACHFLKASRGRQPVEASRTVNDRDFASPEARLQSRPPSAIPGPPLARADAPNQPHIRRKANLSSASGITEHAPNIELKCLSF